MIYDPASYEIRVVIHFLHAKNMRAAEIHRELCTAVYSRNVLSEGTLRQLCRMFKDGQTNVYDEELSVPQPEVIEDIVQSVDPILCERRRFTISKLLYEFPQITRILLCEIVTLRLSYHKFYASCVPKIFTSAHKTQRMISFGFYVFRAIQQRCRRISQSHNTSNRCRNLGFICEC
jgi:hypothetical protein